MVKITPIPEGRCDHSEFADKKDIFFYFCYRDLLDYCFMNEKNR